MVVSVSSSLPVLIAGAGPAGLALAQGLRKRNIPFRVFERDINEDARGQGWAVALQWVIPEFLGNVPDDLQPFAQVSHLYSLGLKCEVAEFDGDTGQEMQRWEGDETFFRADRLKLRDWLRENVNVEWNKRIRSYSENDETVKAHFEDGTTVEGCMLIGGDGLRSSIRSQLIPSAEPGALSMEPLFGTVTLSRKESEEVFTSLARSVALVQAQDMFIFYGLHRFIDDGRSALWYWMAMRPKKDGLDRQLETWNSESLYKEVLEWIEPLSPKFRYLIEKTKPADCIYKPDFMETWSPPKEGFSTKRVTLIGDAAHKITPCGTGVNHAIEDGIRLCRLFESQETIEDVIREYDQEVTTRGRKAVAQSSRWPVLSFRN